MSFRFQSIVLGMVLIGAACGGGSGGEESDPSSDVASHSVVVRWRPSPDAIGYVVHWGDESGRYGASTDVGAPPLETDGASSAIIEYERTLGVIYVALTSYDVEGRMSAFSNELAAVVP